MKKSKLLSLLIFILLSSLLLTSCSNQTAKKTLDTLYNDDYSEDDPIFSEVTKLNDLKNGYQHYQSSHNIAIFSKTSWATQDATFYKVYSLITESVILVLNDKSYEYDISCYGDANYFVVCYKSNNEREYVAYDLTGAEIARSNSNFAKYRRLGEYIVFNDTIYKPISDTGKLEVIVDIDLYSIPSNNATNYNDKYIYFNNSVGSSISIYSADLKREYYFEPPSYVENLRYMTLNNGNVVCQGRIPVADNTEEEYDYYLVDTQQNITRKYNNYHILIDPAAKTAKELDLGNYILSSVSSAYTLNKEYEEDKPLYGDGFDNIAYVCPIIDKKIDTSDSAMEMLFLENDGKITKSVKILEGQDASLPKRLSADRYLVYMLDGAYTLIDRDGKIIASHISAPSIVGQYIVSNKAIYDFDMNLVYDTRDVPSGTTSKILKMTKSTVFVMESTEEYDTYFAFKDGEKRQLGQESNENLLKSDALQIMDFGYVIKEDLKYIVYNFNGENIGQLSSKAINVEASSDNAYLISDGLDFYLVK